jgi:uncharacterized protein YjbJ (UPF0337 family)
MTLGFGPNLYNGSRAKAGTSYLFLYLNRATSNIFISNDKIKGKAEQVQGQIREGVGKMTGNKTEQVKGKIEQVEGKAQQEIGKVKRASK